MNSGGVLLNMNCSTGKYSWTLKFDPESYWISSGIIESSLVNVEGMPCDSAYSISFDQFNRNMTIVDPLEGSGVRTLKYVLDMDAGKFKIFQGSVLVAQCSDNNFKGKLMRPFVLLYSVGSTVTIVPE